MSTPCKDKGYKKGDLFVLLEDTFCWKKGNLVELSFDDGTSMPGFNAVDVTWKSDKLKEEFGKSDHIFISLNQVKRFGDFK